MKKTILLSALVSLALVSCNKVENQSVNRTVEKSYLVNMGPYTSNPLEDNSTRNVFDLSVMSNIESDLTQLGYDLNEWNVSSPSIKINSVRFSQASSSGLGDAIDSVKIAISRDNFYSKTLLLSEKLEADVNPTTGSSYTFVASQFLNANLGDVNNSKIEIILIPKSGTTTAQDFNASFVLDYKTDLQENK